MHEVWLHVYKYKIIGSVIIPMQEDNLHVDVLAVLVQEVLEEVRDWFVGDVATHDNMSANTTNELDSTPR